MTTPTPAATVHRVHFEDFSGGDFERLVFAYLIRTEDWMSLDWYGQAGGDSGRDVWGLRDNDQFPAGQKVCVLCANWQKLTVAKVKQDVAKLRKGKAGLPDKCIVIGGGIISATLRDKIKAVVKKARIRDSEVWSGPEFEERLRKNAESLLKRFFRGEIFPDSPDLLRSFVGNVVAETDMERLALISSLFDRPVFYTPFREESNVPAFKKAITDTIEALGTGVHRLRDGTEIRRIPSRHAINSSEIKTALKTIEMKLAKLRSIYDGFVYDGDIKPCACSDPKCGVFQASVTAIQHMDAVRAEILEAFRRVYPQFEVKLGLE